MRDIVWWWRRAASRGRPRSDGCARHVGLGMLHLPSPSRPRLVPRIRANESLGTSSRACARTRELARAQQIRDLVLNLEAVLARESVEKTTVCSFSCFYFAVSYVLPSRAFLSFHGGGGGEGRNERGAVFSDSEARRTVIPLGGDPLC